MKNSTLATKLMLAAIFLTVLVYFGVNLAAYFSDPYTTTVAFSYTGENAVTVSGYVVREEEVLEGGGDLVYSSRGEGERVSKGGTVALIYPTLQALNDANTLRDLNSQMEQLQYAQSLAAGSQASARLDEEITESLTAFRIALANGGISAADQGQSLRTSILRRGYAYSGADGLDASVESLKSRINELTASAQTNVTRVSAPKAGLFSGLVDGYESVLTLENIQEMTPADYKNIAPAANASGVGKMIYGDEWSFVTMMRSEDVKRIEVGSSVTIRFQKGMDRDMEMKVSYISAEDSGRRVVVFTAQRYLQLATLLRHQNAQVIFESYDGIRVPRSAVRVDTQEMMDENGQPVLDSQGNPKTQAVTCVYCLWGDTARLKPVKVLWQEEDYILVTADEETLKAAYSSEQSRESRRLRAGDQVITAAAEVYDGKVVQ